LHFFSSSDLFLPQVIEGMDVVKAIEAVGSQTGKTSKVVKIVDSGELEMPEEPTPSPVPEPLAPL
jgi:hypothetical protein